MQSMVVYSGTNTDCTSSEPLKTLVMLCYVNNQFQNLPCMFGTVILFTMPLPFILANKFATTWFQTSKFIKLFCSIGMVWCTVAVQTIKVTHRTLRANSNTSYVMKSHWRLKHYVSADEDDNSDYCLLFINRRRNHRVTKRKQVLLLHVYPTSKRIHWPRLAWLRLPGFVCLFEHLLVRLQLPALLYGGRSTCIPMCEWAFGRNCTQRPG